MKDIQLINNVKRLFPDKAIDLSESLELVLDCIDETVAELKHRIDLAVTERNFDDLRSFAEMAEALANMRRKSQAPEMHLNLITPQKI